MYIKHIDDKGNELGYYQSIKEASIKTGKDVSLLSIVLKHNTKLQDGSALVRVRGTNETMKQKRIAIFRALQEYINTDTHPRFIARKHNLRLREVMSAIAKHEKEKSIHSAYMDWLRNQGPVSETAHKYGVTGWSLSARIKRGLSEQARKERRRDA